MGRRGRWPGARWLAEALVARRTAVAAAIVLFAALLVSPAMSVGPATDDFVQAVRLSPELHVPGFDTAPSELFTFASGEESERLAAMEGGVFGWWTTPGLRLSFWRPISVATHRLDARAWPDSFAAAAAHGILWYVLLLMALARLYARTQTPAVALLALAVYALDDGHGPAIGFVSNRNVLVAAALGVACLIAHDAWRRGGSRYAALGAPLLLAGSLLSGEAGVATLAYLFAYAVWMDRGPLRARFASLAPSAVVAVVWATLYGLSGHGARLSGVYVDPGAEPIRFAARLIERLPAVLIGQFGLPWSDLWVLYPEHARLRVWVGFVVACLVIGVALARLLRRSPTAAFWATGALLSAVPICGTFPGDRLLIFVAIGGAPLVAEALVRACAAGWGWRLVAALLVLVHLVLAPLLLPARSRSMETVQRGVDWLDDAVPQAPDVASRTLVVVSAPTDALVCYLPFVRAVRGTPSPRRIRLLATTPDAVTVTRVGEHELELSTPGAFFATEGEQMLRARHLAFAPGDRVTLSDARFTVVEVDGDGRPTRIAVRLERSLDDPQLIWRAWAADRFVRFEVPPVGESTSLPPMDSEETLQRLLEP